MSRRRCDATLRRRRSDTVSRPTRVFRTGSSPRSVIKASIYNGNFQKSMDGVMQSLHAQKNKYRIFIIQLSSGVCTELKALIRVPFQLLSELSDEFGALYFAYPPIDALFQASLPFSVETAANADPQCSISRHIECERNSFISNLYIYYMGFFASSACTLFPWKHVFFSQEFVRIDR